MEQVDGRAVKAQLERVQGGVQEAEEGDEGQHGELSYAGRVGGSGIVAVAVARGVYMGMVSRRGSSRQQ